MSLSMFKRFKLGEAKNTKISLQVADKSYQHPRGVIGNVLVKVDKFLFPVDFVILDMEENDKVPIIQEKLKLTCKRVSLN